MNPQNCITIVVRPKDRAHVAEGCGIRAEGGTADEACRQVASAYFEVHPDEVELLYLSAHMVRAGLVADRDARSREAFKLTLALAAFVAGATLLVYLLRGGTP